MSRETKISLGKREAERDDKSCCYGVVFGETIIEIDAYDVTLCYHEKRSGDVCKRIVDVSVMQVCQSSYNSDFAYKDIPYDVAVKLERTLKSLINAEINVAAYNKEIKSINELAK